MPSYYYIALPLTKLSFSKNHCCKPNECIQIQNKALYFMNDKNQRSIILPESKLSPGNRIGISSSEMYSSMYDGKFPGYVKSDLMFSHIASNLLPKLFVRFSGNILC